MAPSFATFSRCCALSLIPTTRSFSVFLHTSQLLNPLNRQIPLSQQQVYTKSSKQPYHRHYRSPDNSRKLVRHPFASIDLFYYVQFFVCYVPTLFYLNSGILRGFLRYLVYFSLKDILPMTCYTKIHQKISIHFHFHTFMESIHLRC